MSNSIQELIKSKKTSKESIEKINKESEIEKETSIEKLDEANKLVKKI